MFYVCVYNFPFQGLYMATEKATVSMFVLNLWKYATDLKITLLKYDVNVVCIVDTV